MFNTFRGGIHPPQRKTLTMNAGIENLSVPQVCYIPMLQHAGVAANPVVKKGDNVSEGELIGKAHGYSGANVHASVPGKIIEIVELMYCNVKQTTVVIEAEGAFTTTGSSQSAVNDWRSMDSSSLLDIVHNCGIVGLGGDAFPAAAKLAIPDDVKIDTLIVNGAESEPYLTADDMIMKTYPDEILEGIQITLKILGIKKAIVAVENNKKQAIKSLNEAVKKSIAEEKIVVKQLQTKYPQGSERQLIYTILKRIVRSSALPINSGVVVLNVGTVYAIREAVLFNKPLIDRFVTISGDMINKPGNYKVRLGTKISEIIEECGGLKGTPSKVVIGGPLRGISIENLDMPVIKNTSGILFLSDKETCHDDYSSCIRCGKCLSVCPSGLIPRDIAAAVENEKFELSAKLHPEACIKCSCCSYVCPAKRPLSYFVNIAMETLSQQK